MNDTDNEHVSPFVASDDAPHSHEFPQGDVGDQLRVAKVAQSRRKELLKQYERKENPGDTLKRIMNDAKQIDAMRAPQHATVAAPKADEPHHEFDRKEKPMETFRRILASFKPKQG